MAGSLCGLPRPLQYQQAVLPRRQGRHRRFRLKAGSEITWQAYGAVGCDLTRNINLEIGYRYLYTDYNQGGFLYDMTMSGVQITAGIVF